MIKILIFFIIMMGQAFAASRMLIEFPGGEIRQGSLIKAKMSVPPDALNLPLAKLKGETFGETLYFQQLSPLLKREGSPDYVSDIQVIFIKVPESNSLAFKINDEMVEVAWANVQVTPVDTPDNLIWAEFTAPDFFEGTFLWVWVSLLVLVLLGATFLIWKKITRRNAEKARKRKLAAEFKSCQSYDDVVTMWKRKRVYLMEFPHLDAAFTPFEEVLFRYQFKPTQTENEKEEVLMAYRKLLDQSQGGFHGI